MQFRIEVDFQPELFLWLHIQNSSVYGGTYNRRKTNPNQGLPTVSKLKIEVSEGRAVDFVLVLLWVRVIGWLFVVFFPPFWDSFVIHPETCHNPMQPSMAMLRNMFPWKAGMQVSHWQTRTEATKISTKSLWCLFFFAKSQLGPTNGCHIFHGMFFLVQGPSVSCLPSYGQGLRNALQSAQKKLTSYEARDEKQALPGNWWISWQWKILQRYMQCLIWRTCSFGFGIPKRAG